jgi:hypothetical protein
VPPLIDSVLPSIQTRLEAVVEIVTQNRRTKKEES